MMNSPKVFLLTHPRDKVTHVRVPLHARPLLERLLTLSSVFLHAFFSLGLVSVNASYYVDLNHEAKASVVCHCLG